MGADWGEEVRGREGRGGERGSPDTMIVTEVSHTDGLWRYEALVFRCWVCSGFT